MPVARPGASTTAPCPCSAPNATTTSRRTAATAIWAPPTPCDSARPPTSPPRCPTALAEGWPVYDEDARRAATVSARRHLHPAPDPHLVAGARSGTPRARDSRTGPRTPRSSTPPPRSATCCWCCAPPTTRPTSWRSSRRCAARCTGAATSSCGSGSAGGGTWNPWAPIPDRAGRPPGRRRDRARALDRRTQSAGSSPADLLAPIVDERRVLDLALAGPDARDVWRRVRYVIEQARAWADAGGHGVRRYLQWATLQASEGRVADTILPEHDHDAVRVMTIHAAKGLEFPITIVAGLTTKPRRGATNGVVWANDTWMLAGRGDDGVFERAPADRRADGRRRAASAALRRVHPRRRPPRRVAPPGAADEGQRRLRRLGSADVGRAAVRRPERPSRSSGARRRRALEPVALRVTDDRPADRLAWTDHGDWATERDRVLAARVTPHRHRRHPTVRGAGGDRRPRRRSTTPGSTSDRSTSRLPPVAARAATARASAVPCTACCSSATSRRRRHRQPRPGPVRGRGRHRPRAITSPRSPARRSTHPSCAASSTAPSTGASCSSPHRSATASSRATSTCSCAPRRSRHRRLQDRPVVRAGADRRTGRPLPPPARGLRRGARRCARRTDRRRHPRALLRRRARPNRSTIDRLERRDRRGDPRGA